MARQLPVRQVMRTNLTLRQPTLLFGVSKSASDRIIDHLGPRLAVEPRRRFRQDTVLTVDGTLVPTRDQTVATQSKTIDTQRTTRSSATMKTWKILRDCRLKGDGVHHAMLGIARLHNLALAR